MGITGRQSRPVITPAQGGPFERRYARVETVPPNQRRKVLQFSGGLRQSMTVFLEGVHFDLLYATPREVAFKAVAATLSDLASQGGKPRFVNVRASLRQEANEHLIMELETGVAEAAKFFKVKAEFAMGPMSPSNHLLQLLATGTAKAKGTTVPKPGDMIAVTGALGAAAAALQCLRQLGRQSLFAHETLANAYLKPACRIHEATFLADKKLAIAVDLQDGLAAELNALLAEHDLGGLLLEKSIPVSPLAQEGARILAVTSERWALYGAEDFELLFICSPRNWSAIEKGLKKHNCRPLTIGTVKPAASGVKIETTSGQTTGLPPRLWHPLVRRRRA